jgi:transposase
MKEKIRQLIAEKIIEQGNIKTQMRNLVIVDKLTEEIQNYCLDKLRQLDEDIETLKKVLKETNQ